MDELGDLIDGVVSDEEIDGFIHQLSVNRRTPSQAADRNRKTGRTEEAAQFGREMSERDSLQIAEISYESGGTHFRYSRYLAPDRTKWIRHGLFHAYYENGRLASEGGYEDGLEDGLWHDYHDNGQLAAEGEYKRGKEHGTWRFWSPTGELERETVYFDGVPGDPG